MVLISQALLAAAFSKAEIAVMAIFAVVCVGLAAVCVYLLLKVLKNRKTDEQKEPKPAPIIIYQKVKAGEEVAAEDIAPAAAPVEEAKPQEE